jgi:hypothetical protein
VVLLVVTIVAVSVIFGKKGDEVTGG